jgi:hypothetical protein
METITDTPSLEAFKALSYSQQETLRVRTNLKHITEFMMVYGVSKIEASYSGIGDSGYGIDLEIFDTQGNYMQELVEIFTDALISCAGHDGYENNDGGGGTLTILADGTFKLDHYDNVVSTVDSSYDHNDLLEDV